MTVEKTVGQEEFTMKKSIIVCLLVIAFIASTTPSVRAEPITLTVMAITGITTVALLAATDVAVHKEDANRRSDVRSPVEMLTWPWINTVSSGLHSER